MNDKTKKAIEEFALQNCDQAARNYANMSGAANITESLRMCHLAVSVAYRDAADEIRSALRQGGK